VFLGFGISTVLLTSEAVRNIHLHISWEKNQLDNVTELASAALPQPFIQPTLHQGSQEVGSGEADAILSKVPTIQTSEAAAGDSRINNRSRQPLIINPQSWVNIWRNYRFGDLFKDYKIISKDGSLKARQHIDYKF